MVYLVGDLHGDSYALQLLCKNLTESDIVIQLGDHGCFYSDKYDSDKVFKKMSKVKPRIIFLRGNHDRHPLEVETMTAIKLDDDIKGTFYVEPTRTRLLFCDMIHNFSIKGKTFLALSGAYSVDKYYRLASGLTWFPDEEINSEDWSFLKYMYETQNELFGEFDFILSHTAPYKYMPRHLFISEVDQDDIENKTEHKLDWVEENIKYNAWYCGHFHSDERIWNKGYLLYGYRLVPIIE